jgi:serine/threonine-protein kinase HipA
MKSLSVYLNEEQVGLLAQDDSGLLSFSYCSAWLERKDAISLSRSLPLQPGAFRGKEARPFFAGVLPEETPRKMIASILGISERNDFAMLERIGGECAGAVSLLPENETLHRPMEPELRELTDDELIRIVGELPHRPLLAGDAGVRLSLAGAQDKLPVVVQNGRICIPLDDTPSTHILKPEPERFPGLAVNELFCLKLAAAVGLSVPPAEIIIAGQKPCLLVARYDRTKDENGHIVRVHQEDFCQALGFPPERKYQQEGGPLLRDCIQLLRDWSTAPVLDIRNLIDGLIFNTLIGNADAHGKNYSLLYSNGQRRLAPFYDLVCTMAWPELSTQFSMKIGRCKTLKEITPSHWTKMAEESGLGTPMIRERIQSFCEKTVAALDQVDSGVWNLNPEMTDRISETIQRQVLRLSS